MFYGAAVWDPWLILAQIITVQCLFYLSFGLLLYVFLGELPGLSHALVQCMRVCSAVRKVSCLRLVEHAHVLAGPYVNHLSLSHFFVASSINLHSFSGWMITVTNLLNSLSVALSLMFVVRLFASFPMKDGL
jgi:hypothetical protein